ncbi:hypothetical protein ACWOAN_02865 [Lactococcus taiwanensis]|uniref:hypothetical protein n=1 Tax=Lactococcus taiwanensis TaxID=1151742 RepID=UPI001908FCA1|nr:hypothetical protein [Lactococcus taiwanensis]
MKRDLKIPIAIIAVQVILAALAGAFTKLILQNTSWLLQLIAFIIVFVIVYSLVGLVYLKIKK